MSNRAVLVVLSPAYNLEILDRLLEEQKTSGIKWDVVTPPVKEMEFFSVQGAEAWRLDTWWASNVARNALPIWILSHHQDLLKFIDSVDGIFVAVDGRVPEVERLHHSRIVYSTSSPREVINTAVDQAHAIFGVSVTSRRQARRKFKRAELSAAKDEVQATGRPVTGSEQFFQSTSPLALAGNPVPGNATTRWVEAISESLYRLQHLLQAEPLPPTAAQ